MEDARREAIEKIIFQERTDRITGGIWLCQQQQNSGHASHSLGLELNQTKQQIQLDEMLNKFPVGLGLDWWSVHLFNY